VRKLKKNEDLKEAKWIYEIGGDLASEENALLKASSQNVGTITKNELKKKLLISFSRFL